MAKNLPRIVLSCALILLLLPGILCAHGPLLLTGGGLEGYHVDSWSDAAYRRFAGLAGTGTLIILSTAAQTDQLRDYFHELSQGWATIRPLTVSARFMADSPDTVAEIEGAAAIFIDDRPMSELVGTWRGTRLEAALVTASNGGTPLGAKGDAARWLPELISRGERAGPAGAQWAETASPAGLIRDPFADGSGLRHEGAGLLSGIVIETRCSRTGGLARLLVLPARYETEQATASLLGIGIDERTTLWLDDRDLGLVGGEGSVLFCHRPTAGKVRLQSGLPPVVIGVNADLLTEGFVYNLANRSVSVVPDGAENRFQPLPTAVFRPGDLDGSKPETDQAGLTRITNLDHDSLALQEGLLDEAAGDWRVGNGVVVGQALSDPDYLENRIGGLFWGIARHPFTSGLLFESGGKAELRDDGTLVPLAMTRQPSLLVVDSRSLSWRAWGRRRMLGNSPGNPVYGGADVRGARQSVALVGLTMHLLASRGWYRLVTGEAGWLD